LEKALSESDKIEAENKDAQMQKITRHVSKPDVLLDHLGALHICLSI
jgi:hypothetical protein